MYDFDVLFIGSGHACNHGAIALLMAGKKVAMVEEYKYGGTCTNFGCDAKILLDGPFEYNEGLSRYEDLGITKKSEIAWDRLMAYKKAHIGAFSPMLKNVFSQMGINVIEGHAEFKDAHTVSVEGKDYSAEYIVIGSGEHALKANIPGNEYIKNSTDFLDLDTMPERIAFVGAGIISMEFASIAAGLGKKPIIIHRNERALKQYPEKYVAKIIEKMKKEGVEFAFNETLSAIEKKGEGYLIKLTSGREIEADYVLEATGREANTEGMNLAGIGVEYSSKGIKVDEYMQTSVKNIYASGDCVDKKLPRLTPTAEFESNYIADRILGLDTEPICYPAIPNLVFTLPRIAQTGITLSEASKEPEKYSIIEVPYGAQNEWVNNRETDIEISYVLDNEGYLAGAAIYGCEGGQWIDFLTIIINKKISGFELRKMIFAFPTQTYSLISGLVPLMIQKAVPNSFAKI